jgi:hypothetical protein
MTNDIFKAGTYCWVFGINKETKGQVFLAIMSEDRSVSPTDWANVKPLASTSLSVPKGQYPAYTPTEELRPFTWGSKFSRTRKHNVFITLFRQ